MPPWLVYCFLSCILLLYKLYILKIIFIIFSWIVNNHLLRFKYNKKNYLSYRDGCHSDAPYFWYNFPSFWRVFFKICWIAGLLVVKSRKTYFSFVFQDNVTVREFQVKNTVKLVFLWSSLAMLTMKKSVANLIFVAPYVICLFLRAAFNIFIPYFLKLV